ncbi:MAG: 7-carboxy-7-deazaguanine synthase QueE [Candidatus Brocadiae bacterium]|nr:7-carboxy-7-deazaguanine synthase QueE [Candidatus Brocadiia bacterium]
MLISEIFYSIQGEGILMGVPSIFIRTARCNLHCRWCDSQYASSLSEGKEQSIDEIVKKIAVYPTRFCVITGGEPMLEKEIQDLAKHLVGIGKHVTIETAGTIFPRNINCSFASISPKLSNSTPDKEASPIIRDQHEEHRLKLDVICSWMDRYDYQLKFVVCSEHDIEEIKNFLDSLKRTIPPEKVLLMPEGKDNESLNSKIDMIVAACKHYGFRYCERLHIRLFGNKRGT